MLFEIIITTKPNTNKFKFNVSKEATNDIFDISFELNSQFNIENILPKMQP